MFYTYQLLRNWSTHSITNALYRSSFRFHASLFHFPTLTTQPTFKIQKIAGRNTQPGGRRQRNWQFEHFRVQFTIPPDTTSPYISASPSEVLTNLIFSHGGPSGYHIYHYGQLYFFRLNVHLCIQSLKTRFLLSLGVSYRWSKVCVLSPVL